MTNVPTSDVQTTVTVNDGIEWGKCSQCEQKCSSHTNICDACLEEILTNCESFDC